MRKRFFKISIGLIVTFIMSIMPANIQYIFAAENEMIVDDTVTTGVHYFTYIEETDASGKKGWASDKKSSIKGEEYAQTQHWVWNNDSKEAAKHTYTFTFEGTGVELWGVKSDDYNMFQLDNGEIEKVKIEGKADTPTKLYSKTGLTKGKHTVKVALAENGKGLQVSYAKVIGASQDNPDNEIEKIIPTKVDGTVNSFKYNSPSGFEWSKSNNEAYIDLNTNGSKAEECYYEIPFYGNGIEIFANKSHNHGIVKFTIDGKYEKEVDLYNSTRTQAQSVYKISGLEEGNHTLKAVMQNKKNSGSSNYVNQVAYAEVSHAPYVIKDIILAEKSYEMSEGAMQQIEYTLTPEYVTVNDIVFESQNKDIATVNSKGVITAVKEGTAKITVSSEKANIKKEITVNVKKAVPGIGGSIVDLNTQYTQDRYEEVKKLGTTSATLTAWKNDKAISEISLYSKDSKLSNVSISVSDFKNGEKVLKSDNIKATFIKSVKAYNGDYLGYGDKNRKVPAETETNRSESNDVLYQTTPIEIGFNKLQNVWVEINVPKGTEPGTYTGKLKVTADGIKEPLEFTYTLNVQDAELPDAKEFKNGFDIELWQYPYSSAEYYNVEPFSEKHLEIMKSSMLKYKEIGGHAITTSIVEDAWNAQTYSKNDVHYPSMIKWTKKEDGTFEYDYTHFDKWVKFNKELGIGDKIVLYSIAPWHNSFAYWEGDKLVYEKYKVGDARYTKVWKDFLQDLVDHLTNMGWFEESYIGIDERGFSNEAFDIVDSVKNIHGKSLKTAGAMDGFVNKKELALRVYDLNVGDTAAAAHPKEFEKLLEERNELGLRTTLYSCTEHQPGNFSLSAPVESYWSIINAGKSETAGFLRWAYDAWVEDPLRDTTHNAFEPGDCFLIYPDEKDAKNPTSKSSVRLEIMAKGVRDVNKLLIMEKEVASLESEIDALYDNITITPVTSRSYLSEDKVNQLSQQVEKFTEGINKLTERYINLKENGTNEVESVTIDGNEKEIMLGSTVQLKAVVKPDNLLNNRVTWTSSNEGVASVNDKGVVTANKLGSVTITATSVQDESKKATIKVTVSPVTIDKSAQVSYYSFDKDKDGKVVDEWGSRNGINEGTIAKGKSNNALKVTEEGKSVTLEGDSKIAEDDAWTIAYWVNTDAEFNKEISVISDKDKAFAASLKMAENRGSGFRVGKGDGDVLTFQYDFKPDNWYHIAWTQSKTDGLSMYVNGQLIQKNDWTKNKTVKFPMDIIGSTGFTGSIDEVKVYNKVLNPSEIASTMLVKGLNITENYKRLYIGETYTIETNLLSDNEDKAITYTSSNPNIASVDKNGVVTAKDRGITTITVENKAGGYKEEVTIEVSKKLTISNTLETYELPANRLTDIERSPGGDRQYLGQPDMVRTSTGRLITAYPKGHGKGPIIMQISDDNGETWIEKNNTPSSWVGSQETPTLYVLPLENGKERIMMITACPGWGTDSNGNKTGWNTSYSDDNGDTWTEYKHWYSKHENGKENKSIVGMASLVQLKDESGNYIQKWMGVYHDYDYVNYKTYLTFNENGEEQWSEPEPYLSDYRNIESTYKMCEIGMFRSPDGKRIVGLARSQSHNNPSTMIYSDDEGKTWSKPMDLPGSLAGERHKAAYDPISGRLVISFREIQYDLNGNNTFDGEDDWTAGEWVAWVGTYEDLMEQRDGQYRIEICKDYSKSAKSGDTGYAGVVVLDDGTFIMDSYGHWDEEFSNNWTGGVTKDLSYIKQAKFKLSEIDNMAGLIDRSELEELIDKVSGLNKNEYTPETWSDFEIALNEAINVKDNVESTQYEIDKAKEKLSKSFDNLKKNKTDIGGSEDTSDKDVDDSNNVKTGDTTNSTILYLVALMSLSAMFIFKRKRRSI
ncbi:MAG: glycoside hydrolase domain-containing protein [Clostridium paraputrificum]